MSNPTRGAIINPNIEYYHTPNTKSLNRRCRDIINVLISGYSNLGTNYQIRYYGNSITWDVIKLASLVYGTSSLIKYPYPASGYIYRYDMVNREFQVYRRGVLIDSVRSDKIADFGISYSVLQSSQFYLFYGVVNGNANMNLKATNLKTRNSLIDETNNIKSTVDSYGNGVINIKDFLDVFIINANIWDGYDGDWDDFIENINEVLIVAENPEILRSNGYIPKSISADYSTFVQRKINTYHEGKIKKRKKTQIYHQYELLLSLAFIMTNKRGLQAYEPWMLWSMWKWVALMTPILERNKTFDISPNWEG